MRTSLARLRARLPLTQLRWLAWGLALHLPMVCSDDWLWRELLALSGEWCVIVALGSWLAPRRGVALAVGVAWLGLFLLECARLGGLLLMAADPQLYDLLFLMEHLQLLLVDLWGPGPVLASLVAVLGLAAALCGLASWRLRDVLADVRTPRVAAGLAAVSLGLGLWPDTRGARWVTPDWLANAADSWHTWQLTQASISVDHYAPLRHVEPLARRPDIGVYVVESYGRVVDTTESLQQSWRPTMEGLESELKGEGWHMASGWATAPVSGGRSWISDASVMLGISIRHQSTWAHMQPRVDQLTHLPGWLAEHGGYQTVVCRPKDRARLGVELRDDFDWMHTVFADDIPYEGPQVGWGGIPDQFSLGHLHTDVLSELEGPRFVFFHGVSAHAPWGTPPELEEDWRAVGRALAAEPSTDAEAAEKDVNRTGTLKLQARRYAPRKSRRFKLPRHRYPEKRRAYMGVIDYSLRATFGALSLRPDSPRGQLVVVYGDHPPPMLPRKGDYDVPVHVLASDPALLAPFREAGFVDGLRPDTETAVIPLQALFPLLASAVMGRPLPEVPPGVVLADLLDEGAL